MRIIDPSDTQEYDFNRFSEVYGLTKSEAEIVGLIVEGKSNLEISDIRDVAKQTIKNQTQSIYQKTNSTSRAGLMRVIANTKPPIAIT